jgi:predicted ester cyclase
MERPLGEVIPMSIDSNKDLIVRQFEAFNAGDIDGFAEGIAEDAVNHAAIPQAQGRAGARSIATKLRCAFPDMHITVDDVVAEGDKIVCRLTATGTHEGRLDFVKFQLPATGKRFRVTHIHVFRIAGGKVVEHWAERDDLGLLQQLGVMPSLVGARTESAVPS